MRSEPVKIRVGTLRVILKKLSAGSIKELYADDMVTLEVLSKQRLRLTNHRTGEISER